VAIRMGGASPPVPYMRSFVARKHSENSEIYRNGYEADLPDSNGLS
jgi:hypothetical protein